MSSAIKRLFDKFAKLGICRLEYNDNDEPEYEFKNTQGMADFDKSLFELLPDNCLVNYFEHDEGTSIYFIFKGDNQIED